MATTECLTSMSESFSRLSNKQTKRGLVDFLLKVQHTCLPPGPLLRSYVSTFHPSTFSSKSDPCTNRHLRCGLWFLSRQLSFDQPSHQETTYSNGR